MLLIQYNQIKLLFDFPQYQVIKLKTSISFEIKCSTYIRDSMITQNYGTSI